MKRRYLKKGGRFLFFCSVMVLGAFLLMGCGDDGDTGATGATGPKGDKGDPGESIIGATAETCSVCHGEDSIADIAVAHPDDPAFTGSEVIISDITLTNTGGFPVVSFHLEEALSGDPVVLSDTPPDDLAVDKFRFMMADLVPAGTVTSWGTFDSPYWERWVYEQAPSTRTGIVYPQGTLDISGAANGNYTYTFATAFGSPAALLDAPDYDPAHPQRLLIRFDGTDDPDITQRSVGFLDFNVPAAGEPAVALDPQRQFVTAETCEQCHSPNWERAAHAGGYRDTRACVICHSPLGNDTLEAEDRGQFMQETDTYASVFFHKIHAAIDIPHWTDEGRILGLGYSAVTFPQPVKDCVICHTDLTDNPETPEYDGDLGTEAGKIDNWKTHPTAEICGSCHVDVDFTTGENHEGGAQPNSNCTVCHPNTGGITSVVFPVPAVHDTTATGPDVPEFDVTITIDPPANGTHYVEDEAPEVLVTLVKTSDGLPVDSSVYTAPQDAEGNVGGGLASASLYVYGPRAKAVPVLTTGSTTDPNFDPEADTPQQAHPLFKGGTDSRVTTSGAGFSYQLLPITADLEPGTYMVRFEGGDFDTPSGRDDDYVTHSTALETFQVKEADEEFKVAGDACLKCHGDTRMHLRGAHPHNAAFDTDECLGCHDLSARPGNFAVPIANRVHAVHAANAEGDIYVFSDIYNGVPEDRPWFEVTFPREIGNCNTCHDSQYDETTNTFEGTYKTLPYMMPCSGCHVGMSNDVGGDLPFVPGVYDHMVQNGGPW